MNKNSNPTLKDVFAKKIASEIFNYRKNFGVLTFTVKFNSGVASSLIINSEEHINLSTLHKKKVEINRRDFTNGN
ncbi:MAG: hypothetical protein BKP49_10515 [Treponema sp. CETP13]|nr:MAG: hypothetical protein BKP49_10515 [Treponema sp. CETP13]